MEQPNLRTVAQRAGVSVSSVSNAYNRPDQLSAKLRDHILGTARELGYPGPHPAARSLRTRSVGAIGVLLTTPLEYAFADPYCLELLRGVSEVLAAHHTHLVLIPQADADSARQAVVDAVIADGLGDDSPALQAIIERGLPVALSTDSDVGSCAVVDDRASGRLIGEHLASQGVRDVTVLLGTTLPHGTVSTDVDDSVLYAYSRLRLEGIRQGLGEQARVVVMGVGGNTSAAGAAAAEAILAKPERPQAIAADSDVLAVGVLQVLSRRGLEGVGAIAVTGFDDLTIAADAGITTVRQPIREKGRVLASMLLDPASTGQRVVLETTLVPRASTLSSSVSAQVDAAPSARTEPAAGEVSEWAIEDLDIDAYLRRIGYEGPREANERTLRAVHRAHVATIPFENLELMLGRDISVDIGAIQQKLVFRQRGGYCYEQNLLFSAALERLGFRVDRFLARTGDPAVDPRPRSHLIAVVELDGARWLVDVGFGSGLLEPIPLVEAGAVAQGTWTFQITRAIDGAWRLRELRAGEWSTRYTFTEERLFLVDVEGANHVTSTSAKSPFTQRPILVGRDEVGERAMIGRELKMADAERDLTHEVVTDERLPGALLEHFGIRLSREEISVLAQRLK